MPLGLLTQKHHRPVLSGNHRSVCLHLLARLHLLAHGSGHPVHLYLSRLNQPVCLHGGNRNPIRLKTYSGALPLSRFLFLFFTSPRLQFSPVCSRFPLFSAQRDSPGIPSSACASCLFPVPYFLPASWLRPLSSFRPLRISCVFSIIPLAVLIFIPLIQVHKFRRIARPQL